VNRRNLLLGAAVLAVLGGFLVGEGIWIRTKAVLAQFLLERAFNQTVAGGVPVKPWQWSDTWPVARLRVPRLGAEAIVLSSGSGQSLAFGPGHLEGTPEPGERGTAVFAAHRDTHFAFLPDLQTGDLISITRQDGVTFPYRVTGAKVVRWDEPGIDIHAPGYHLALSTCWPVNATLPGPLRYVVLADLDR